MSAAPIPGTRTASTSGCDVRLPVLPGRLRDVHLPVLSALLRDDVVRLPGLPAVCIILSLDHIHDRGGEDFLVPPPPESDRR